MKVEIHICIIHSFYTTGMIYNFFLANYQFMAIIRQIDLSQVINYMITIHL